MFMRAFFRSTDRNVTVHDVTNDSGSPGTATTTGARDHARSQAGTRVRAMPTVPPSDATDLPEGVDPADVVWDEVVAAGGYTSKAVDRGTRVRLEDLDGDACAGLLLHAALQPAERLNVADTVKVQWQAYLGAGSVLLSDMGRALATIALDTSGRHDTFCGTTNRAANTARYGDGAAEGSSPNGRDRFAVALAKHGLDRRDVAPNVNLFKGVRIEADGTMSWDGDPTAAGAAVELVAEMPLLVSIVNVAHPLDPRTEHTVTPLRVTAWRSVPTVPDDPQWSSTPERQRAYENTDAHLRGLPALTPGARP